MSYSIPPSSNNNGPVNTNNNDIPHPMEAARHICQEARNVLSSLRSGPPHVARGELAQGLRDVRLLVKSRFLDGDHRRASASGDDAVKKDITNCPADGSGASISTNGITSSPCSDIGGGTPNDPNPEKTSDTPQVVSNVPNTTEQDDHVNNNQPPTNLNREESVSTSGSAVLVDHPVSTPTTDTEIATTTTVSTSIAPPDSPSPPPRPPRIALENQMGPIAFPFLAVILDPHAAGPHTLVALRSLYRLLSRKTLLVHPPPTTTTTTATSTTFTATTNSEEKEMEECSEYFVVSLEPLIRGVLECRFEQTDAGADEAVEMAIADLLNLMVDLDFHHNRNHHNQQSPPEKQTHLIEPSTFLEAFNTVFVTRNTFVHSPALCYHFEEVLNNMVSAVFAKRLQSANAANAARCSLEFLVSQLLHTPLLNGMAASTTSGTASANGGGMLSSSNSVGSSSVGGGSIGADLSGLGIAEAHAMHDATRILCLRLIQSCIRIGWGGGGTGKGGQGDVEQLLDEKERKDCEFHNRTCLQIVQDDLCLALLNIGQGIWAHTENTSSGSSSSLGPPTPGMISTDVLSEVCSVFSTMWNVTSLRNDLVTQFESIFTGFYQRALSLLRRLPVPNDTMVFHANQIFDAEMEIILESLVDILCLHGDDGDEDNGSCIHGSALEKLFLAYDCDLNKADVVSGMIVELCRCCGGEMNAEGVEGTSQSNEEAPPARHPSEGSNLGSHEHDAMNYMRHVPAHLRELCAEALVGSVKSIASPIELKPQEDIARGETKEESDGYQSLRAIKERKRLMFQAAQLFNEKSSKGIEFLVSSGLLSTSVTPKDMASFLRNGIVVGLDKRAIGEFLGEKGKPPKNGESPPCWRRDWFHKETLEAYCSSFHFENETLLDGLRMFLAAFRLPGEAQQIDRILQAFAESCGHKCVESKKGGLPLFTGDPKKASDGAYILSFSIIMLNTDLHNTNIRADRKMTVDGFVLNNTNYGKDITDPGCELPRPYLEGIYSGIRDEPIRTEGEGADGVMTFERWKDVLRVASTANPLRQTSSVELRELVVDTVCVPIISAIGGFWGVTKMGELSEFYHLRNSAGIPKSRSGMLNAQGARLGMDLTVAMLSVLKNLPKSDAFQTFFQKICMYSGLLQECKTDAIGRTSSIVESVERQSVIIVVVKTAIACGDLIGHDGWKMVWSIIFELRDLKLLGSRSQYKSRSLFFESDADLLLPEVRREWEMLLVKDCHRVSGKASRSRSEDSAQKGGLFSAMGRAFFGSDNDVASNDDQAENSERSPKSTIVRPSLHGKEELLVWNELATSDVEDNIEETKDSSHFDYESASVSITNESVGCQFEKQLIHEDKDNFQSGAPITGLETYEDIRIHQMSPRARVRKRLALVCDFSSIVSETRFFETEGLKNVLTALVEVIKDMRLDQAKNDVVKPQAHQTLSSIISPASEAFAEVLVCEISLKNRDRIGTIWDSVLRDHYYRRLTREEKSEDSHSVLSEPGIEKCLTGLLRICYHSVNRDEVSNEILRSLELLYAPRGGPFSSSQNRNFDKHLAEGIWRICCDGVHGLQSVDKDGWDELLGLIKYCASKGNAIIVHEGTKSSSLSDDDPAFKAFRCIHLLLHSPDLKNIVPYEVVHSIRALISAGEKQKCPKLSIAGLDLLQVLHLRLQSHEPVSHDQPLEENGSELAKNWIPVVDGIATASDSIYASVRQHSIAMLTDALVDRHGQHLPTGDLCRTLYGICIPMVGQRISELTDDDFTLGFEEEEILIELELCICALFKPFTHHLGRLVSSSNELASIWMSILTIMVNLLGKEAQPKNGTTDGPRSNLLSTTKELAAEHLRNALMVLMSNNIIHGEGNNDKNSPPPMDSQDMSSLTWKTIEKIPFCHQYINEWKSNNA